ncbi:MAG: catalase [Thermoflexales bacterium]|nr:catalase [Thermoflexales bacterium]
MDKKILTTESGAPVGDNQNSQTAGPNGPILMQDHNLIEKLARFERERIPERVVHAKGSGAFGHFEVTADVTRWTRAAFLSEVGKRTEVFVRFSTVAGEKGSADAVRDPRGFAIKFYTEEGNYDLVGNNTPIFFIRDPIKFPDFIHSQKRDPYTNVQEPDNVWDFFSLSPEATHQFTWLFGDRGIPASYRHMDGFGSHTFHWLNAGGEMFWVKYHFKTDQGIRCFTAQEAARVAGENPDSHHLDLLQAIERGEYPSWTLKMQIMPAAEAAKYRFNPFDLTKVWPYKDYPLIPVGKLVLNRNPENYFAQVEQAAFNPANFVLGIGPSPDKMFQGRLFAYGDAHRYRLGINHTQLPVNAPRATKANNYGRDGLMRFDGNYGRDKNYEPNSFGGPQQTGQALYGSIELHGATGSYAWERHPDDNDFVQAGKLYRVMDAAAQQRLIDNIAGNLSRVSREDIIERSIAHFRNADPDYGRRVAEAVVALRKKA